MAMAKSAMISFTIMALFGASMAATFNVGEDKGWTTIGNIDYKKWADGKNFQVGDTLVFKYNPASHDVKQVNEADFKGCNGKNAMATYTTGTDSVTLKEPGRTFFLCGFPGHCQVGQKLEINVHAGAAPGPGGSPRQAPSASPTAAPPTAAPPAGTPSSTPPSSTPDTPSSSSPNTPSSPPSAAPSLYSSNAWLASALVALGLAGFAF